MHYPIRLTAALCAFVSLAANAATVTVDSAADNAIGGDGNCTLREAITNANLASGGDASGGDCVAGTAGADEIQFAGDYTIVLASLLPAISDDLTMTGNGVANTVISGNDLVRVMRIDAGTVALADLAIVNGRAEGEDGAIGQLDLGGGGGGGAGQGGGLYMAGGDVVATNVLFDGNVAAGGDGGDAPDAGSGTNTGGQGGVGGDGSLGAVGGAGGGTDGNGGGGGGGGAGGGVGGDAGGSGNSGGGGGAGGRGGAIGGGNGGSGGGCGGGSGFQLDPRDFAGAGGRPDAGSGANCRRGGGGGGGGGLGGAVFVASGTLELDGVDFDSNSASGGAGGEGDPADGAGEPGQGKGGALFVDTGATVINTASDFADNSASDDLGSCLDNDDVYSRGSFGGAAPTDLSLSSNTVPENQPAGTTVGTLATTDPDCVDDFVYSLVAGSGDSGNAAFQISGDELRTAASLDFEAQASYSIRLRTTDNFGQLFEAVFTINVTDVNEAPTASPSTFSVSEDDPNGTAVGTVSASDPESDPLQYAINSGNVGNAFAIGAGTGEITVNDAGQIDFETLDQYTLEVEVSDDGSPALSDTATIIIDVADANEAPEVSPDTFSVDENPANGTAVGTVTASDPDGDPLTFSITAGNAGNAFEIDASGQIAVADGTQIDYETLDQYTLTVEAADNGSPALTGTETVTIDINDVNEAPTAADVGFAVSEDVVLNQGAPGVLVDDSDPEGDALSVDSADTASALGAVVTVNGDGSFSYDPTAVAAIQALNDGEQLTDTFTYTVTDGEFTDTASISIDVAGATAALSMDKEISAPGPIAMFQEFEFVLTVENAGPGDAQQAVVTDELPSTLEFVTADCGTQSGGTLTWSLGLLEAGESRQCTMTMIASRNGGFSTTATLDSLDGPPIEVSARGEVFALPIPAIGPAGLVLALLAMLGAGLGQLRKQPVA